MTNNILFWVCAKKLKFLAQVFLPALHNYRWLTIFISYTTFTSRECVTRWIFFKVLKIMQYLSVFLLMLSTKFNSCFWKKFDLKFLLAPIKTLNYGSSFWNSLQEASSGFQKATYDSKNSSESRLGNVHYEGRTLEKI